MLHRSELDLPTALRQGIAPSSHSQDSVCVCIETLFLRFHSLSSVVALLCWHLYAQPTSNLSAEVSPPNFHKPMRRCHIGQEQIHPCRALAAYSLACSSLQVLRYTSASHVRLTRALRLRRPYLQVESHLGLDRYTLRVLRCIAWVRACGYILHHVRHSVSSDADSHEVRQSPWEHRQIVARKVQYY